MPAETSYYTDNTEYAEIEAASSVLTSVTALSVTVAANAAQVATNKTAAETAAAAAAASAVLAAASVTGVASFEGRVGAVVSASGDYNATELVFTPAGSIAATSVSGAIAELDTEKAALASPTFTGAPAVPTAALGTNTTQAASCAFARAEVAALVDAAPGTLDTLNELAAALGDDPNFAATTAASLALKATKTPDYLVKTADAGLDAERVVTDTASVEVDWATAGQAKFQVKDLGVGTGKIADDAVTYAKMQNASAADVVLGRSTGGAGNVEEIPFTAAGRAVAAGADAAAQRTSLSAAARAQADFISGIIKTGANQDFRIVERLPIGATLTKFYAKTSAGTITLALKINTTAVTNGSINVTSTQGSATPSAANVLVAGDALVITGSSNSSGVDISFLIEYTMAFA